MRDHPHPPRRRQVTGACFAFATIALAALAYGSLLPFEFVAPEAWLNVPTSPRWFGRVTFDDLAANLVLYVPVAAALAIGLRRCGLRSLAPTVVTVITISAFVWCVECGQSLVDGRYASLNDWLWNVGGAGIGAASGAWIEVTLRRGVQTTRRAMGRLVQSGAIGHLPQAHRTSTMIAAGGLAMLIAGHGFAAAPRQITTPTAGHVNWMPMAHQFMMPYLEAAASLAADAAWYAAIGLAWWIHLRLTRSDRSAWRVPLGVAAVATAGELMQWFDPARYPDLTEPLIALFAAAAASFAAQLTFPPAKPNIDADAPGHADRVTFDDVAVATIAYDGEAADELWHADQDKQ